MRLQVALAGALSLLITGCGTVNTTIRGDAVAIRGLKEVNTRCASIPRVYSGVSYDFCTLHAEPSTIYAPQIHSGTPIVFLDFVLSGALDTVALPYTIYRQTNDGNIEIR